MNIAVEITEDMIMAGVTVYENPDPYETYEMIVIRIFTAMIQAALSSNHSICGINLIVEGHCELLSVGISE
jgi:hypothetical protein